MLINTFACCTRTTCRDGYGSIAGSRGPQVVGKRETDHAIQVLLQAFVLPASFACVQGFSTQLCTIVRWMAGAAPFREILRKEGGMEKGGI